MEGWISYSLCEFRDLLLVQEGQMRSLLGARTGLFLTVGYVMDRMRTLQLMEQGESL